MAVPFYDTGFYQHIDPTEPLVNRIPDFDPRGGDHYWIQIVTYRVDPGSWGPDHTLVLDRKNLAMIVPPGCYYCERPWTPQIGRRRCTGPR